MTTALPDQLVKQELMVVMARQVQLVQKDNKAMQDLTEQQERQDQREMLAVQAQRVQQEVTEPTDHLGLRDQLEHRVTLL